MEKSKKIIIIFILIALVIFLFVYFSLIQKPKDDNIIEDTGGTNFFQDLINFGKRSNVEKNDDKKNGGFFDFLKGGEEDEEILVNVNQLKIRKISSMPVAGFGVYLKESFEYVPPPIYNEANVINSNNRLTPPDTELVSFVKYIERRTGNIYQNSIKEDRERRFSETIIPNIEEGFFLNNTNSVLMRFLRQDNRTIASFLGQTRPEILGRDFSTPEEVNGQFLPENILNVATSPSDKSIFYLTRTNNGSSGSIISNDGLNRTQIFTSPLREWLVSWPHSNTITLTTKPSGLVSGYMFILNPQSRDFYRALGNINGLTTLTSKDGKKVLFSNNTPTLSVYNVETKDITPLEIFGLPEKCVWSFDNRVIYCMIPKNIIRGFIYPDVWYQGEISFNDDLWRINTENNSKTKIFEIINEQNTEEIDGINLTLDNKEDFVFFMNKKDYFLWNIKLK